jgi:hypothetical protein
MNKAGFFLAMSTRCAHFAVKLGPAGPAAESPAPSPSLLSRPQPQTTSVSISCRSWLILRIARASPASVGPNSNS